MTSYHEKSHRSSKRTRKASLRSSDSGDESEHELFYYANDRVRLMKEVLKILKLKKIKSLAPDCIKKMDLEEMNTMLLEELLGISRKRLKNIFAGQADEDQSSSSDEDKEPIDIISLDDISDDDNICIIENDCSTSKPSDQQQSKALKTKKKKIKKEPKDGGAGSKEKGETEKPVPGLESDKLLSVLELLELQARARAIRSQLAIEAEQKAKTAAAQQQTNNLVEHEDDGEVIEVQVPEINEIVISSSSSSDSEEETEKGTENNSQVDKTAANGAMETENNANASLIDEKVAETEEETCKNDQISESNERVAENIEKDHEATEGDVNTSEKQLSENILEVEINNKTAPTKKKPKFRIIRNRNLQDIRKEIEQQSLEQIPLPVTEESSTSDKNKIENEDSTQMNQELTTNNTDIDSKKNQSDEKIKELDSLSLNKKDTREKPDNSEKKHLNEKLNKIFNDNLRSSAKNDLDDNVIDLEIVEIDGIDD